jgi:glycosyl transferase, family 25
MKYIFIILFFGLLFITIYMYLLFPNDEVIVKSNIKQLPYNVEKLFQDTYYINLIHRNDRKRIVEKELLNMGLHNFKRFNALTGKNGHIGCSRSHLDILKQSKQKDHPFVTILEDDIHFKNPEKTIKQLDDICKSNDEWDVIILGGIGKTNKKIKSSYSKANGVTTTTGYIVNKNYVDKLIDHWEKGLKKLLKEPEKHSIYALDQTWKELQEKDNFIILNGNDVIQRSDFSDIQNGYVSNF